MIKANFKIILDRQLFQFNFVLSIIVIDIFKAPTTTVKFPIVPKEKLTVTLRYKNQRIIINFYVRRV